MNPRWSYSADKGKLKKGPWTFEEDLRLLRYIRLHGEGRWSALAKAAGLQRCGKSCRLRWVNYLRPDLKRGNITPEEEQVIIDLHARWGNRWSLIAERMPGRTDNEIKNYWRCHLKKKLQHNTSTVADKYTNDESPFPSPQQTPTAPLVLEQQVTLTGNAARQQVLYEDQKHCSASASASASLVYEDKQYCSASASLVYEDKQYCSSSASLVYELEKQYSSSSASASLVYELEKQYCSASATPLLVSSSTADQEVHRKAGNSDLEAQRGGNESEGINESVLDAPPSILYRFPSGIPIEEEDAAARVLQVPSRANSNADYNAAAGCEVEYWGLDVGADIMLWNLCSTPSISQCESHSPFSYAHHM